MTPLPRHYCHDERRRFMAEKSKNSGTQTIGKALDRVDGPLKVRGAAPYTGDVGLEKLLHAVVIQSTIASGTITKIDASAAQALGGVAAVFSHENRPFVPPKPKASKKEKEKKLLFDDSKVHYHGQIVALVVAETF